MDIEADELAAIACSIFLVAAMAAVEDRLSGRHLRSESDSDEGPKEKKSRPNLDEEGKKRPRTQYDARWHANNQWWLLYTNPLTRNPSTKEGDLPLSATHGCELTSASCPLLAIADR